MHPQQKTVEKDKKRAQTCVHMTIHTYTHLITFNALPNAPPSLYFPHSLTLFSPPYFPLNLTG